MTLPAPPWPHYREALSARFAALLALLLVVSGCAPPGSAAPLNFTVGSTNHALSFGGLDRSYRLYVPDGLTTPAPLVVMLHGGFGSAEQAERAYGWDQLAEGAKFVVAYPDGDGRAWNTNGGCCGHIDGVLPRRPKRGAQVR